MNDPTHWYIAYLKAKGSWLVRIPLAKGKPRVYIGTAMSQREAERMRDAAFMKHWGRIPSRDEV